MPDLRARLLERLDWRLEGHDLDWCSDLCVHGDAAALHDVVVLHGPNTKLGAEDTCAGCAVPGVAFVWLDKCRTIAAIAAALGLREDRDA